jgi:hypothetical protein
VPAQRYSLLRCWRWFAPVLLEAEFTPRDSLGYREVDWY